MNARTLASPSFSRSRETEPKRLEPKGSGGWPRLHREGLAGLRQSKLLGISPCPLVFLKYMGASTLPWTPPRTLMRWRRKALPWLRTKLGEPRRPVGQKQPLSSSPPAPAGVPALPCQHHQLPQFPGDQRRSAPPTDRTGGEARTMWLVCLLLP